MISEFRRRGSIGAVIALGSNRPTVRRAQGAVIKTSRNRYVAYVRTRIGGRKGREA